MEVDSAKITEVNNATQLIIMLPITYKTAV